VIKESAAGDPKRAKARTLSGSTDPFAASLQILIFLY